MRKWILATVLAMSMSCGSGPEEILLVSTGGKALLQSTPLALNELSEQRLQKAQALVLWDMPTDSLSPAGQRVVERYIQAGGCLALINSPVRNTLRWPWLSDFLQSIHPCLGDFPADTCQSPALPSGRFAYDGGTILLAHEEDSLSHWLRQAPGRLDYARANSPAYPDPKRFTQQVLTDELNEPMQIAVAQDGRVFIIERLGPIKLYDPGTEHTKATGHPGCVHPRQLRGRHARPGARPPL
ncbi:MAG: ThuA domain-containing protein [Cytophagales bacterium]|nr:ThuA domain-containing protein [Cytophagales bacterium]